MDFFAAQEASRQRTRRLLLLFLLACILIVAAVASVVAMLAAAADGTLGWLISEPLTWAGEHLGLLITTVVVTTGIIALASAYRTAQLTRGGGDIARTLGGTQITADSDEPLRARLRNVVEEMAIASGVPVPEIYVLENEAGINAFAAGFGPGDAAIAVTRGCLEQLDRAELQGVIAHEFSHILNGDMRLNLRLVGVLFGILVIGMVGRMMLHGGRAGAVRLGTSRRGGGGGAAALLLVAAAALILIGSIGVLFGRIIRAGVSRQREFLADASAVQFTRNPGGIAGALKKIGGYAAGSDLTGTDSEEISHMLFARGGRALAGLFATHPPLAQRIAALDAHFKGHRRHDGAPTPQRDLDSVAAGFSAASFTRAAGQVEQRHIDHARALREGLPAALIDAAHSRNSAPLLVFALLLHPRTDVRERQQALLARQLGSRRGGQVATLATLAQAAGCQARLPLLELAFPAFKERPVSEIEFHVNLAQRMTCLSGDTELFEYCLLKLLSLYLQQARAPGQRAARRLGATEGARVVGTLLAVVAMKGASDSHQAAAAYASGREEYAHMLDASAVLPDYRPASDWISALDHALAAAHGLSPGQRRAALAALSAVITHDGHIGTGELELLRVVCAAMDVPVPPQLPTPANEQVT